MSGSDQRSTRCFIDTAGLHSDDSILNAIGATDSIGPGNLVQIFEELHGPDAVSVEADRNALFEIDRDFAFAFRAGTRIQRQHE